MATQYETVTVTVAGANPQTITVLVPVDTTTGNGSTTFSYTGTNGGTDNLTGTGTFAGIGYTSNVAEVNWQTTNGSIQVGNIVTCIAWGDSPTSGPVAAYIWCNSSDSYAISAGAKVRYPSTASYTQTNNSLAFDYYTSSGSIASGVGGGADPIWSTYSATGTPITYISFPPYTQNFNCCITGYILVPAAGSYTLNYTYKDSSIWGLGASASGAVPTWAGKGSTYGGGSQTMTVVGGYPLLPAPPLTSGGDGYIGSSSVSVSFPQAGVYPIECDWDYWYRSGRILHVQSNSTELAPVTLISAPPPSTPSGTLTITPAGGLTNLQLTSNAITLTVTISGVTFTSKSYCPVLEGTTGNLILCNSSSANTYTFQTYNGSTVNKTAYAPVGFQLSSSDNTAYSGLFSVGFDGTNFNLNYNGNTANSSSSSRVLSTGLIITADDVAWFNSTNNSFDLFVPSGSTGGNTFTFEIDYMNKPSVASISPSTITANGGNNTLVIVLNKAFSPQQQGSYGTGNTVNCTCTITGAASTGSPVPNLDSSGWLTGWNIPFIAPSSTTNQTMTVNLVVSGTLTYLSGNTFVTGNVTYINGAVGTITATGMAYVAPSPYSFSVSPALWPTQTTPVTLTAVIFTPGSNSALSVAFSANVTVTSYYNITGSISGTPSKSTYTQSIGTVTTAASSAPATVGGVSGYLQTYILSTTANFIVPISTSNSHGYTDYTGTVGYTATNTAGGLSCTYSDTTIYTTA